MSTRAPTIVAAKPADVQAMHAMPAMPAMPAPPLAATSASVAAAIQAHQESATWHAHVGVVAAETLAQIRRDAAAANAAANTQALRTVIAGMSAADARVEVTAALATKDAQIAATKTAIAKLERSKAKLARAIDPIDAVKPAVVKTKIKRKARASAKAKSKTKASAKAKTSGPLVDDADLAMDTPLSEDNDDVDDDAWRRLGMDDVDHDDA
jgi:hypothetical protein